MKIESLTKKSKDKDLGSFYLSFSDLMVILCTFFVMLLSLSEVKLGAFDRLKTGFTGSTKGTLTELANDLTMLSRDNSDVSVEMADDGVRVNLKTAALFESGSSILKKGGLRRFRTVFERLQDSTYSLDVEGHSDDVPLYKIKNKELTTNWSLSGKRASSVVNYLLDKGFGEGRLRIVGYASTKPYIEIEGKRGAELLKARALNRRVSILVK